MNESNTLDERNYNNAVLMFERGFENKFIESKLTEKGVDEATITRVLDKINSLRYEKNAKRKQRGAVFMILGVFLLAISFILSAMMYESNIPSVGTITTFLTSVGAVTIMVGISNVFAL
jgi:predicted phage tail protein